MQVVVGQNFSILGSGSYLPSARLTSEDLDARCGMKPGWCRRHVGVELRYECLPPETMISMGCEAIRRALDDACLQWHDVDAIIDCSTSQFRPVPCNAAHYQQLIGRSASGIPCFDIHSTCLGALVALHMINGLIHHSAYKHIVVVASESGLGGVNYAERESACLIGDGAAALVLGRASNKGNIGFAHQTFAEHIDLCRVEGGGHKLPVFQFEEKRAAEFQFTMDGRGIFRIAIENLKPMVIDLLRNWSNDNPRTVEKMHIVPHQASPRALQAVQKTFSWSDDFFHQEVHRVGNMVAASIPYMLDRVRKDGLVTAGEKVLALGTSAGYSQAALIFEM
ncbi:MAG: hypothetical protein KDB03_01905 [Planctomycetales bacterium]|nr:hypothetical protein [Planctomycetales bacterium]